mmetsp:Transcript_15641/g.28015  ORF Transcript_15641/g.28015 Transcript_15641/m.28015 type:complete len:298 (+) Transcript_15641:258-1151(+)
MHRGLEKGLLHVGVVLVVQPRFEFGVADFRGMGLVHVLQEVERLGALGAVLGDRSVERVERGLERLQRRCALLLDHLLIEGQLLLPDGLEALDRVLVPPQRVEVRTRRLRDGHRDPHAAFEQLLGHRRHFQDLLIEDALRAQGDRLGFESGDVRLLVRFFVRGGPGGGLVFVHHEPEQVHVELLCIEQQVLLRLLRHEQVLVASCFREQGIAALLELLHIVHECVGLVAVLQGEAQMFERLVHLVQVVHATLPVTRLVQDDGVLEELVRARAPSEGGARARALGQGHGGFPNDRIAL